MAVMRVIREYEIEGLGDRIRRERKACDKSITMLSAECGMTTANWYRVEKEDGAVPEETLEKMQKALGVNLDLPFGKEGSSD